MRLPLALFVFVLACGPAATAPPRPPPHEISSALDASWKPVSFAAYIAPTDPAAYESGAVDVIFHFHAGRAAEAEYRASGLRAVIVDVTVPGFGTTPYWNLMDDPHRFEHLEHAVVKELSQRAGRPISFRHVALVSWSAGYATVQRILAIQKHYDEVDAVILLDGLHSGYVHNTSVRRADIAVLAPFIRFAKQATLGQKLFVFTHSSIPTYKDGYASTTEVADALALELGMTWTTDPRPGPQGGIRSADLGDAHIRGFAGELPHDHVIHDHFIGTIVKTWLAPRW